MISKLNNIPDISHSSDPEDAAIEWHIYLYSENASDDGRAKFEAWLKQSPDHGRLFKEIETNWRDLSLVENIEDELVSGSQNTERERGDRVSRRTMVAGGAIAAALAGVVLLGVSELSSPKTQARHASSIGEIKSVGLPDGSIVTLDSNSTIEITFSKKTRSVTLVRGRAHFDVEPETRRAFTVDAGLGRVTVVGTAFDLWRKDDALDVSVVEGVVEFAPTEKDRAVSSTSLAVGERIIVYGNGVMSQKRDFDPFQSEEWRAGRIDYEDAPLGNVIEDINRYRRKPIRIIDSELNAIRLTVGVRVDQSDIFLAGLEATQPISVRETQYAVNLYKKR